MLRFLQSHFSIFPPKTEQIPTIKLLTLQKLPEPTFRELVLKKASIINIYDIFMTFP